MTETDEARRGAAVYSKRLLGSYDLLVVHLSNSFVWRCHRSVMAAQYARNVGVRHLDVGPGTGWFLANSFLPRDTEVTLLDLNPNSLASARQRLPGADVRTVVANVLEPLPDELGPFDSVSVNYVLHCLPGSWAEKGRVFGHLASKLAPGGVLFGATVLGRGVRHNLVGRRLMRLYNQKGIFHNTEDDLEGLEDALRQHFGDVTVRVMGAVALFQASAPHD